MSRELLGQVLNKKIIANMVSNVLKLAHQNDGSSIKQISKRTGIEPLTISNWYQGKNAPSSIHLLTLMTFYPQLLQDILEMISSVSEELFLPTNNPYIILIGKDCYQGKKKDIFSDKCVPKNIYPWQNASIVLNKRQLWFLKQLHQEKMPNPKALAIYWQVSVRTAKRDIAYLSKNEIVGFFGALKNGHYHLK